MAANSSGQSAQTQTPPPPPHHSSKGEFLKCLSEFFKRDLLSVPIVKKYPHSSLSQRCGLKASTIELDTAAYPNIEYIAGTRLSVYPLNPASHVTAIMEHLIDDIGQRQVMVENWNKFVQLNGKESLRLALTYLFDIMTAPSRELIKLLADNCREKEQRKKLVAISQTNESWERWLCSGHRTLKSLFDELSSCKLNATIVLNELNIQQPRQYSISNIKSAKRFRAEIIVVQHRFSLHQIELNLRQLRDRETYEREMSPAATSPPAAPLPPPVLSPSPSPPPPPPGKGQSKSNSRSASTGRSAGAMSSPAAAAAATAAATSASAATVKSTTSLARPVARRATPPTRQSPASRATVAQRPPTLRARVNSSKGSHASNRSIRPMASFASSPITTHQVRRVSSFSGPLMSAYANASSSTSSIASGLSNISQSGLSALEKSAKTAVGRKSLISVLESQNRTINSEKDNGGPTGTPGSTSATLSPATAAATASKYEGLCSSYLLNLNSCDHLLCEFVENPRFTLKGNRERPIMMIGQDVGMIAYRPFWQQRHLEHDRAHVFYALFKDLSPKKFGDMQLVSLTGHKSRIEDLFKREITQALTSKILSSYTAINRKHFLNVLSAATNKSQLVLSQLQLQQQQQQQQQQPRQLKQSTLKTIKSTMQTSQQLAAENLPINSKELLELGDRIYKLLVENNGCLYTCCDPHMTQAIEILAFESIARNNSQLTRDRLMKLLPKWKGRAAQEDTEKADDSPTFYTLENTYERAQIVQEIYDSSI